MQYDCTAAVNKSVFDQARLALCALAAFGTLVRVE